MIDEVSRTVPGTGSAKPPGTACRRLRRGRAIGPVFCCALLAGALLGCVAEPPRIGAKTWFEPPGSIAWSPDGRTIAVEQANTTWLVDVKSGEARVLIRGQPLHGIEFSRDSLLLASGTRAWEVRSGRLAWRADYTAQTACSTGAGFVLSTFREVLVVDPATSKVRAVFRAEPYAGGGRSINCSADGRFLARSYAEGIVTVWDIAARTKVGHLRVREGDELFRVALGPGAEWLAAWIGDRVLLFPRDTWSNAKEFDPPMIAQPAVTVEVGTRSYSFNPQKRVFTATADGRYLAGAGIAASGGIFAKARLMIVDLHTKNVLHLPHETALEVAFSPDSARLAVLGARGIDIWDVRAGTFIAPPQKN